MSQPVRLSLQNPCHEKWENFAPTTSGGFCSSCNKNVTDFTKMTDREVIEFIKSKPTNACGRFRSDQLKEYTITSNYWLDIKPSGLILKAGLISLLLGFISKPTIAQSSPKPATEQTLAQKLNLFIPGARMVRGVVVDDDSIPIPGVNIVIVGTAISTISDHVGKFEFPQPVDDSETLTFSFIGFKTYISTVGFLKNENLQVKLYSDEAAFCNVLQSMTGEFTVQRESLLSRIKSWFR
jgi:hypothetical protein